MNREDTPDEDKLGYEFWNAVEELPIIKQIKDYNETTARQSEYLAERARSGQSGLLSQGLQAVSDTLGTVVGLPFQALETGIQAVSDRTNIDARTLGAVKDIIGYSKAVKVPKSGKFYKGVQTTKGNIATGVGNAKIRIGNLGKPNLCFPCVVHKATMSKNTCRKTRTKFPLERTMDKL